MQWLKIFFALMNGNAEYQKYLSHLKEKHPDQKVLSKKEFFAQKEKEKWGKINRCC